MSWIDISIPMRTGMVHWPGDSPVQIERTLDIEEGDSHTMSAISMGSHTGTHIDAPLHFIKGGIGIDRMPAGIMIGRARVLEIKDPESIKLPDLAEFNIRRGERILFKTLNSAHVWETDNFLKDYVYLSDEAADFLADRQVRLVGIDYLSIGAYKHGTHPHQSLLGAGIWVVEGLDLSRVKPGRVDLVCLPLRLENGDGAPARAFVRPVSHRVNFIG